MSFVLPHLESGWAVDQAILGEEERVVVLRFGRDWNKECIEMDEVLYGCAEKIKKIAVIYLVDTTRFQTSTRCRSFTIRVPPCFSP